MATRYLLGYASKIDALQVLFTWQMGIITWMMELLLVSTDY